MEWRDLFAAFALFLVYEGLMPFLNPSGYKRFLAQMQHTSNLMLRKAGVCIMFAGLILLYIVR